MKGFAQNTHLKPRRSSAFSSLPSLCQVILGKGTALKGTGMCSFSVSTTTRSRVWNSRVGLPENTEKQNLSQPQMKGTGDSQKQIWRFLQSESLAKTFSEMSDGSLSPIALTALTLRMYSFSGVTPSSTRYLSSFTGREFTLIHFSVPASHISMWYPLTGAPPSVCGGFQAIARKSRLAPVTCNSMGGDGMPGGENINSDSPHFKLFLLLQYNY